MPNCSNFWVAWIRGRIHKQLRTMEAGLITCRRRTSSKSPRRLVRRTHRGSRPHPKRNLLRPETRKMSKGYSLVLAVLLAAATPAFAQQPPQAPPGSQASQGVPWSNLSGEQQKLLGKFSGDWNTLPPERQQALARGSDRWLQMSPDQRGQAQQRFQQFRSLPPEQRNALRDRWQRFQSLPQDQQAAVRQNFRRFKQLPPERRQMLRQRWQSASPAERQQMIHRAREAQMRRMQMRPDMRQRPDMRPAPQRSPPSRPRR